MLIINCHRRNYNIIFLNNGLKIGTWLWLFPTKITLYFLFKCTKTPHLLCLFWLQVHLVPFFRCASNLNMYPSIRSILLPVFNVMTVTKKHFWKVHKETNIDIYVYLYNTYNISTVLKTVINVSIFIRNSLFKKKTLNYKMESI